jgi:uncharacterized protein (TIGR02996 family)
MDSLDRALMLWRHRPTAAHVALVDRASSTILREPLATADAWLSVESAGDPADVPRLVEALAIIDRVPVCVGRLLDRPPDPRILAASIELLETPTTWTSGDLADSLWRKLLEVVRARGDVRHSQRMFGVTQLLATAIRARPLANTAIEIARELATRAVPADVASPPSTELVAELDRLDQRRRASEDQSLHLFEAIWAAPDDDAPRAVLADFFTELGEPRGEFISLQLAHHAGKLGAAGRKRAQKLLTRYKRAWTGAIAPLVFVPYARFERGFIVGCQLARSEQLGSLADHPAWSTIREITLHPLTRAQNRQTELATTLRRRGVQLVDVLRLGID